MAEQYIEIRIKRQKDGESAPYWEEFQVTYQPNMNVISLLQEIQRNPVTKQGQPTTPVAWDCSCLEEVCGACTMVINGQARQSCSALVDKLEKPVVLEPMRKFPVVRDLVVDRARMFEALKKVHAWVEIDGTYDLGPGMRQSPQNQEETYDFSRCMTCGCCVDACPQYTDLSAFVGPSALGQVFLFNKNPVGSFKAGERLRILMGEGGIQECGNAQNCVRVCPKEIPLTKGIAALNRATMSQFIKDLFNK
ncbi:MAG: succinate dehydrogenase iron-sulfur subunit [bacterium]|jgi:succinate dehydrogenase / fumarate reductase iron-sulfur subunit|nr:succinate dehydrogenase iron-sulfur subunit [bacterium]